MVIRNEEQVLERALNSVKDIVDEMIILHDGPVEDASQGIAVKFGATFKVMEPWIGVAEPWRVDALEMSKNSWILRLDADEYFLSQQYDLFRTVLDQDCDMAEVQFGHRNSKSEIVFDDNIYIPVLFKKEKIGLVGATNETFSLLPGATKIRTSIKLVHDPTRFGDIEFLHRNPETFRKKTQKWITLQARSIVNWEKQPRWNYPHPRYEFKANDLAARSEFFLPLIIIPSLWWRAVIPALREKSNLPLLFAKNLTRYYWEVFKEVRRLKRTQKLALKQVDLRN
jgi:glycosyltransferase involved in cell wall biosynthesis